MSQVSLSELAYREQDGLEVTLLWEPCSNEISIEVIDQRNDSILRASVPGRLALDAFHHPYSYVLATEGNRELASANATRMAS